MRKITKETKTAYDNYTHFRKANMEIRRSFCRGGIASAQLDTVYLHGNAIIKRLRRASRLSWHVVQDILWDHENVGTDGSNWLKAQGYSCTDIECFTLAGWNTPTTRERINGILGVGLHQKNHDQFVQPPKHRYGLTPGMDWAKSCKPIPVESDQWYAVERSWEHGLIEYTIYNCSDGKRIWPEVKPKLKLQPKFYVELEA